VISHFYALLYISLVILYRYAGCVLMTLPRELADGDCGAPPDSSDAGLLALLGADGRVEDLRTSAPPPPPAAAATRGARS
jgi:hypothetical protein